MDGTSNGANGSARTSILPRPASRLPTSKLPTAPSAKPTPTTAPTTAVSKLPLGPSSANRRSVIGTSSVATHGKQNRLSLRPAASRDGLAQASRLAESPVTTTPNRMSRIGRPPASALATPTPASKAAPAEHKQAAEAAPAEVQAQDGEDEDEEEVGSPGSTMSLTERTMQTLARIPSSPAIKGRPSISNFFEPEPPTPRASRSGSNASRPGSSGYVESLHRTPSRARSRSGSVSSRGEDTKLAPRPSAINYKLPLSPISGTPASTIASGRKSLRGPTASRMPISRLTKPSASTLSHPRSRTPSPEKPYRDDEIPNRRASTMIARAPKSRPSMTGLFKKPSLPVMRQPAPATSAPVIVTPRKVSAGLSRMPRTPGSGTRLPSSTSTSLQSPAVARDDKPPKDESKSSAALREQIAKAKAAKKAAAQQKVAPVSPLVPTDASFDFGLAANPSNQKNEGDANTKIIRTRAVSARSTGRLNISALCLSEIPEDVTKIYDRSWIQDDDGGNQGPAPINRFIAADNELVTIGDYVFPDVEPRGPHSDPYDGTPINIFTDVETMDLHGNMLVGLPNGVRRLTELTSLNLAKNKFGNETIGIIAQLVSLTDLNLSDNQLKGCLVEDLSKLRNLQRLDLHGNELDGLPPAFADLSDLRVLDVSENVFSTLPWDLLADMPLVELTARKNRIGGSLFTQSSHLLNRLQTLDVSYNQFKSIIGDGVAELVMPALTSLIVSMNRLGCLPELGSCPNLSTLLADENSISTLPDDFCNSTSLKTVNLASNLVRTLPAEIASMSNLTTLRLDGNPLRDRNLTTAPLHEVKEVLRNRLPKPKAAPEPEAANDDTVDEVLAPQTVSSSPSAGTSIASTRSGDAFERPLQSPLTETEQFSTPPTSTPSTPARKRLVMVDLPEWPVATGGLLDRSSTESSSLDPMICSRLAQNHTVQNIQLQRNLFTAFPGSLAFFASTLVSLSLARNQLLGEQYLGDGLKLSLPHLKELDLSSNHITSLQPLIDSLEAPSLHQLDVSVNRIHSLPNVGQKLLDAFPKLEVLHMANNHLTELQPDSVRGLSVVDAANNDLAHLDPRLGLLGGSNGLKRLVVTGNRFRVPRWNVLERGTEATLRWLRGRVPVTEAVAWREAEGTNDDDVD